MTPLTIAGLIFLAAVFLAVAVFMMVATRAESAGRQIKRRLATVSVGDTLLARRAAEGGVAGWVTRLEQFAQKLPMRRHIGLLLEQANVSYLPGQFLLLCLFLGIVGLLGGFFLEGVLGGLFRMRGVLLGLVLAVFFGVLPYLILLDRKRTRIKRFTEQFPDALEMIARSLRAGHGFNVAMQMVAQEMPEPVSTLFKRASDEQSLGLSLPEVLKNMALRLPTLDVQFFASAVVIQRETGGNLAEIMDKLGYVIRERFRILGQIRVYTAQGRLTGYILAALPIVVGFILYLIRPDYVLTLFQEQMGLYMIGTAAALQIMGFFVIRRIIHVQV
jgi:tight adherence protein B